MFIFSNLVGGFCRNYVFITYMLMSGNFKNENEKGLVHAWYTLTNLGDIVSIPFSQWMIYSLGVDWSIPLSIFIAAIALSALGIRIFVKDIPIQE